MTKAQMSLEMIIGLLILLVVAVVVIRMFLRGMESMEELKNFKNSMDYSRFKAECEKYCTDFFMRDSTASGAQYCLKKLYPPGSTGIGKKGLVDRITIEDDFPLTEAYPVCEDGIYCFHLFDCAEYSQSGGLRWADCKSILCNYFYDTYKNWTKATEMLHEKIPNVGSCVLNKDDDNWWKIYFRSNCGQEGVSAYLSCEPKGTDPTPTIECEWSDCPTSTCYITCENKTGIGDCGTEGILSVPSSGTHTYTTLTDGVIYSFHLLDNTHTSVAEETVSCCVITQ